MSVIHQHIALAGKAPWVEIMTSTFSSDWMKALQNPNYTDVTFILDGNHKLEAHRLVLCAASKFFQRVFKFSHGGQVVLIFLKIQPSLSGVLHALNLRNEIEIRVRCVGHIL